VALRHDEGATAAVRFDMAGAGTHRRRTGPAYDGGVTTDNDRARSTTARLLVSLDVILSELTAMEAVVRDAPPASIGDTDRRTLRAEIDALAQRADMLMEWLSNQRLESLKN
jgi:hypothetical protein